MIFFGEVRTEEHTFYKMKSVMIHRIRLNGETTKPDSVESTTAKRVETTVNVGKTKVKKATKKKASKKIRFFYYNKRVKYKGKERPLTKNK